MAKTEKKAAFKQNMEEEAVSYCDRSSIIGVNYFFSQFNAIEKAFWVSSVIIMLIIAAIEVNIALAAWNQSPTVTTVGAKDTPISGIQFPTVTVCPAFTLDKNGFVRNMLNLLKFQCDRREGECQESKVSLIRMSSVWNCPQACYRVATVPDSTAENVLRDVIQNDNSLVQVDPPGSIKFFENLLKNMTDDSMGELERQFLSSMYEKDPLLKYFWNYFKSASSSQNISFELEDMSTKKLKALLNNFDIYEYVSTVKNYTYDLNSNQINPFNVNIGDYDESTMATVEAFKKAARLLYMALAMPLPGQFGTMHFNFQTMTSSPDRWFCDTFSGGDNQFSNYYTYILFGMLQGIALGVSPSEISAILDPLPVYFDMEKYPRQFPYTVWNLIMQQNVSAVLACPFGNVPPPDFVPEKNYFGKLLGPHLMHVMEIMFHCRLRIQPIDNSRYQRLSSLYGAIGDMELYLKSQLTFSAEPFNPSWTDYKGNGTQLPYFWTATSNLDMGYKQFENMLPSTSDENNDNTLELLRAKYQYQQMMALCTGPGGNASCADKFEPVITDTGICYAFNALDFNSTVINNAYTEILQEIYLPGNKAEEIISNTGNGNAFKLLLVLDSHKSKIMDNLSGQFNIGINQIYGFMNVRDTYVDVKVGYLTKVTLVPTQITTTDAFKQQHIDVRGCRYTNENADNSSLFKFYSYSGCIFECRLRYSTNKCGCTPWNYPQYGNESITEICDGPQSYCFEEMMDARNNTDCECLPDCEAISYTITSDVSAINYYEECTIPKDLPWGMTKQDVNLNIIIGEKIRHMDGEEFLFWYELIQKNQSILPDIVVSNKYVRYLDPRLTQDKCLQLLKNDFALLTIEIAEPTMSVITRDMAVDSFTIISNVGGTLGLFTGIGILSFVEIAFLIYRMFRVSVHRQSKEKK